MTPILYAPMVPVADTGTVSPAYLCHLSDCTVCEVTEERNGIFELYLQIPTASEQFQQIAPDCLIGAKPNDTMGSQYFRVYAVEKSMGGLATVSAEHISYLLVSCPVDTAAQIAGTANDCINLVLSRAAALTPGGIPFTGYSDIETMYGADFRAVSAREALTGIQSLFGGEFLWDNFAVRLLQHRGQDRGVKIAYRKNLTGLKCTTSTAASYTALYPFYKTDLELITLPEGTLAVPNNSGIHERVLLLDLTEALSSTAEAHDAAVAALASTAQALLDLSLQAFYEAVDKAALVSALETCESACAEAASALMTAAALSVNNAEAQQSAAQDLLTLSQTFDTLGIQLNGTEWGTDAANSILSGIQNDVEEWQETVSAAQDTPDDTPIVDALRAKAEAYLEVNDINAPSVSMDVDFIHLWQTPEFAEYADLERVSLCDTVHVSHPDLLVDVGLQVIETVYDALTERYTSIALGTPAPQMASVVQSVKAELKEQQEAQRSELQSGINQAVAAASAFLSANVGGYVKTDIPGEILIMDKPELVDAQNIWRWNSAGLGFSSNGYAGPFQTAITARGEVTAQMGTFGVLNASVLRAGTIASGDGSSWWNLETGDLSLGAVNDALSTIPQDLTAYIRMGQGTIELGHTDSPVKARITGAGVTFLGDGEVATMDSETLTIKDGVIGSTLAVGGYKWMPTSSGGMDLALTST